MLLVLPKPVGVLLVEHDPRLQCAIRAAIMSEPAFELVAVCTSKRGALEVIETMSLDIVLVSLRLEDGSGLDVVQAVKQYQPLSEVLVMGTVDDKEELFSSMKAGATACLLKENFIHPGKVRRNSIVSSVAFSQMLGNISDANETSIRKKVHISGLSPVQRDILQCLAGGLSNKEIARRLFLSSYNVDYHLKCLRKRFSVHNRVQLISAATTLFQN